ncbi:MAG TPA: cupin domain-containing protein [Gaiellaceae bacterium]|nr:cupin domain-containing protein [Gaiellaceae bacterium]
MSWYVLNARDCPWVEGDKTGLFVGFEDEENNPFPQLGINVRVLQPGQAIGMYHSEAGQEDFLVLDGEGIAIVDSEERPLGKWDMLHCGPGVAHMIKATGDRPLLLVCAGARTAEPRNGIMYLANELARKHGVSVDEDTPDNRVAYAEYSFNWADYQDGWLP